ncbi:hypothetical protein [Pseudonocardia sp. ICBG601]|uniref:hypothetical protein n=1 Tax=Pseudonocardia sp. ICBG601 TaxID=2846759 RepID=UPI001CF6095E|nr:hypothetical protein [Pseudonocardia sp. ICBG601]
MKRPVLLLMTAFLLTACGGQSPAAETQVSASFARAARGRRSPTTRRSSRSVRPSRSPTPSRTVPPSPPSA